MKPVYVVWNVTSDGYERSCPHKVFSTLKRAQAYWTEFAHIRGDELSSWVKGPKDGCWHATLDGYDKAIISVFEVNR